MSVSGPAARGIPDPRNPVDRRQRDGLGLLPRARTAAERAKRERLNRLLGWLMMVLGVVCWVSSLYCLFQFHEVACAFSAFLAVLIAIRGLQFVTWQDRRKTDRRRPKPPP